LGQIADRRTKTAERIRLLADDLEKASELLKDKACVYAIGSFGRLDASSHSDLDAFIVAKVKTESSRETPPKSELSSLDEILVKAELIHATKSHGIPPFDGDGRYLRQYTIADFIGTLGTPDDDATNTFTARLLMLLEGRCIVGRAAYDTAREEVITSYWRDYEKHKGEFVPAFFANDIIRLWRTFCVNYEARTTNQPERQNAKRKLKNYKLRHSRLLTCYSTLLMLLDKFQRQGSISPTEALDLTRLTPTERLETLQGHYGTSSTGAVLGSILAAYDRFLEETNFSEDDMIDLFLDAKKASKFASTSGELGDLFFKAIAAIGNNSALHRVLVV